MPLTITEALAEIKTIGKRIAKKQDFIGQYIHRQEKLKDPLANEAGGSRGAIERERQAISDLQRRVIDLRLAINQANVGNRLTVNNNERSIAEWIIWKREVAPIQQAYLGRLRQFVQSIRQQAASQKLTVKTTESDAQPDDVIMNIDEAALARDIEALEETLGILDGQLSQKNATVFVNA